MSENRRIHKRYGSDMIFWMKQVDSSKDFSPFYIVDISAGGLKVETKQLFTVGTEVHLSFELPQHTDLIEAMAIVRHIETVDEGYHTGLQFQKVKGVPTSMLMEYLEEIYG